ncbi:nuclear transport factor 2 family protein [Mucilaginibacter pedocola]|uniref:SnoaL-like domain-containing protein n=1 Tax=Mucilaginibacter pedocola TaxID=1792845 RepID=A0A1S9P6K0_9SPHI|nr:nuclear transport factor 2 family protein [Mucilaginibacter pedocola]OOQ56571.1 hypothetical protein BC343_19240 [Mucilaginibacter pedocola]
MEIPNIITQLIEAQNRHDAPAYSACFTADATVADEGKTHHGREAIEQWISAANAEYQARMKALSYSEAEGKATLTAEISGTFAGSPIVLNYNFVLEDGLIRSLKISG